MPMQPSRVVKHRAPAPPEHPARINLESPSQSESLDLVFDLLERRPSASASPSASGRSHPTTTFAAMQRPNPPGRLTLDIRPERDGLAKVEQSSYHDAIASLLTKARAKASCSGR